MLAVCCCGRALSLSNLRVSTEIKVSISQTNGPGLTDEEKLQAARLRRRALVVQDPTYRAKLQKQGSLPVEVCSLQNSSVGQDITSDTNTLSNAAFLHAGPGIDRIKQRVAVLFGRADDATWVTGFQGRWVKGSQDGPAPAHRRTSEVCRSKRAAAALGRSSRRGSAKAAAA